MQRSAIENWMMHSDVLLPPGAFLDPFCGAGATLDAAAFAPRSRWNRVIGSDLSPLAVAVSRGHCAAFDAGVAVDRHTSLFLASAVGH